MTDGVEKLQNEIVIFTRKRDYKLVRELGQGACGRTVLLYDDQIEEYLVCKKYSPYAESERETLYRNFVREVKILHQLHHPNLVRVFNYYLYPHTSSGFILMEFVDGEDLESYVASNVERLEELFLQAIEGFKYLEQQGVLHRDIRTGNLFS